MVLVRWCQSSGGDVLWRIHCRSYTNASKERGLRSGTDNPRHDRMIFEERLAHGNEQFFLPVDDLRRTRSKRSIAIDWIAVFIVFDLHWRIDAQVRMLLLRWRRFGLLGAARRQQSGSEQEKRNSS